MRQIPWTEAGLLAGLLFVSICGSARADDLVYLDRSDRGFNLPGVSLPQGQDEVHAADGTTCRSAIGGSGTYLDVGAIKDSLGNRGGDDVATYARVVIPLGTRPSRLDCAKLYALEVERLQLELRLLKMGIATGQDAEAAPPRPSADAGNHWTRDGWSDAGVGNGGSGRATSVAQPSAERPARATRQTATRALTPAEEAVLGLY